MKAFNRELDKILKTVGNVKITQAELSRNDFTFHGKCKSVPLQARIGPEGYNKLRFPDFVTTAQDGGKVVSFTHRPPSPPGNIPGTHLMIYLHHDLPHGLCLSERHLIEPNYN